VSLWDREVAPLIRAAAGQDTALRRVSAVCVEHAVRRVVSSCGERLPTGDAAAVLGALVALVRQTEDPIDPASPWPDMNRLEAALPDPDSELHWAFGWGCAIEAVLDLAHTLRDAKQVVDAACCTLDLAYQAATREAIQAVMTRAVDEGEYTAIEESVPECRAEIDFQRTVLRSL
jgi:hypothetical protein